MPLKVPRLLDEIDIVRLIAEEVAERVSVAVIDDLQKAESGMDAGDYLLPTVWDVYCASIQGYTDALDGMEEACEEVVDSAILERILELKPHEYCAIWLQTDSGQSWMDEAIEDRDYDEVPDEDQMVFYVGDVLMRKVDDFLSDSYWDFYNEYHGLGGGEEEDDDETEHTDAPPIDPKIR